MLAHLQRPGPGEILHWDAAQWPTGAAIRFEWRGGDDGIDRRRWYVRTAAEGRIAALWSYSARPRTAGDGRAGVPESALRALGRGARAAPLEHGGNSGAAFERVELADGSSLILTRVAPAADWLARATHDTGRTGRLWQAGAFARLDGSTRRAS